MPRARPSDPIRQLLDRRDLASARHRTAMGRRLGLAEAEMLAVAHVAQRGRLTPSELGALLELSSGGVTSLVQRLRLAGHVERRPHPGDRRSVELHLSDAFVERADAAFQPLVDALDQLTNELSEVERTTVQRFLRRVVLITEEHADRARTELARRPSVLSPPVPRLWS